jgi:hypothetical protein
VRECDVGIRGLRVFEALDDPSSEAPRRELHEPGVYASVIGRLRTLTLGRGSLRVRRC